MSDGGLIQELFQGDLHSLPGAQDPAVTAKLAAAAAKEQKERKAAEAAAAKAQKPPGVVRTTAAAAPKSTAPNPTTIRQLNDAKLHKIRLYFGTPATAKKLSIKEPKPYPKTEEEIDSLLRAIENELASSGGIQQAAVGYLTAINFFEQFTANTWNPLQLDLTGPQITVTQAFVQNRAQWDDILTEFAISQAEWFMVGPFKRLLFTTASMIMTVSDTNKMAKAMRAAAPASENLKEKSAEL